MQSRPALLQAGARAQDADRGEGRSSEGRSQEAAPPDTLARWGTLAGQCVLSLLGLSNQTVAGMEVAASGAVLIDPLAVGDTPIIAAGDSVRIERCVTVNRSRDELYQVWRQSERLSLLTAPDAAAPDAAAAADAIPSDPSPLYAHMLDWDVAFAAERWPEWLVWRSHPEALVEQVLSVRLTAAPVGPGTVVQLSYECAMSGGPMKRGLGPLGRRLADARARAHLVRFMTTTDSDGRSRADGAEPGKAA
jgi:uncharacterized membrane protein